jgi:hypothetical protein
MSTVTDCDRAQGDLVALLDGEIGALEAATVRAHLSGCAACSQLYELLRSQILSHAWASEAEFDLDDADVERLGADEPDGYGALRDRLRGADVGALGTLLYEILKAEFLHDYGDNVEAEEAPIADPAGERGRGSEMVAEMRDWYDRDDVDGVDLGEVARRLGPGAATARRLDVFIEGMEAVSRLSPGRADAAAYYQALAHIKARRADEAEALLRRVTEGPSPVLARYARISLAGIAILLREDPGAAIPVLERCLGGDAIDAIVEFNLAKAFFLEAGRVADDRVRIHLERARVIDGGMVARQLARADEAVFARAVGGAVAPPG